MRMVVARLFACAICCVQGAAVPAERRSDAPLETVRAKFAAFNKHDADAIQRIYADEATLHSPDYPGLTGNKSIADTYRKLFATIPDAQDNLVELEMGAAHVYAQFVLTGHLQGAADKPVRMHLISVYVVKRNRIAEDTTYYDRRM